MKILITGAKSGIGYASALELAKRGHKVYLTLHKEEQLLELQENPELKGYDIEFMKLDITNQQDRKKISNLDLDALVNNAAIGIGGSIIEADINDVRNNFEVNVISTIELTRIVLEKMIKRDSGRIINITSVLAEMPFAWLGIYSGTKAALKNISIALNKELKVIRSNVKVCIVEPGAYHTGFNQEMMEKKYNYEGEDSYFELVKNKIRTKEKIQFALLESHDLTSIVNKIAAAIEDEDPKMIYRALQTQTMMERMYSIFKR